MGSKVQSGPCVALQMDQLHAHAQKDQKGLKICLLTNAGPKQLWALLYSIVFGFCLYLESKMELVTGQNTKIMRTRNAIEILNSLLGHHQVAVL